VAEARHVLSIDLPPDDVDKAIDGFNAIIANAQPPLTASEPPQPPTTPQVATPPVVSASLTTASPPASAAPSAAPAQIAPPVTDNSASATPPPAASGTKATDITVPPADTKPSVVAPPDATVTASAAPTPPPAAADSAASAPAGSYQVQLGALPSQVQAQKIWDKLSAANPDLFGDKTPNIESATVKGKTYYRLRTGSFASKADAAKFCGEVSAAGSVCTLANF
jgi:septal ring-binding cell division protein DamX